MAALSSASPWVLAYSRTSCVIFIEQKCGPHMEQKCATLAPSAGRVSSWKERAVSGTNLSTRSLTTAAECRRFQRPYDLRVLTAVERAPFNLLHVCGEAAHFDEFADYPVTAFSWATVPGNPTLAEGRRKTGRAVVGGFPGKPDIAGFTGPALAGRARRAIDEMHGHRLLLGPDCSINPDTSEALLHAAGAAAREPWPA